MLRPNLAGLFDLHGNVSEWCHDWNGDYESTSDPLGAATGSSRVIRGGSWFNGAADCRSAVRSSRVPTNRGNFMGFRLALGLSLKREG